MEIITYNLLNKPSQSWFIDKTHIGKFGIFRDIDDILYKPIHLYDISDELFSIVFNYCNNNSHNFTCFTIEILLQLFNLCDFLNFNDMQITIATELSNRISKMTITELSQFIYVI